MKANWYPFALLLAALLLAPGVQAQVAFTQAANPAVTPAPGSSSDSRGGSDVILTQSLVDAVFSTSIRCATTSTGITTENSFWRRFELPALGLDGPLTINEVHVGIGEAVYSGAPAQYAKLRFYAVGGPFFLDAMELIEEVEVEITEDMMGAVVEIPITGVSVPTNVDLGFELHFPHCTEAGGCRFSAGINDGGEDAPTYISSTSCGIDNPTPIEDVGSFPPQHWVLTIYGQTGAVSTDRDPLRHDVVLGVYPNPAAGHATIQVQIPGAERVVVTVVDMLGRTVADLHDGLVSGELHLPLSGAGLSAGTYVVRIVGETFRSTRTFSVAR